jgi:hypothetical protein
VVFGAAFANFDAYMPAFHESLCCLSFVAALEADACLPDVGSEVAGCDAGVGGDDQEHRIV